MSRNSKDPKPVRPIRSPGIAARKFEPVLKLSKRVKSGVGAHPLAVLIDLKNGSLAGLANYLAKNRSIPDREVAIELLKLIKGTRHRTKYRLVVIEHPDLPADRGGRPKVVTRTPRTIEIRIHDAFETAKSEMKTTAAASLIS